MLSFSVPAGTGAVIDLAVGVHPHLDFFLLGLRLRCLHYRADQVTCRKRVGFKPTKPLRVQRLSRRVIAYWLAGKLLKTKDAVRLGLDGLGTLGSLLG